MTWFVADLTPLQQLVDRFGGMRPLLQMDIQKYLKDTAGPLLQRLAVQNISGVPFPLAQQYGANPPTIRKRTGNASRGIDYETPYMGMPTSLRLFADARTYTGVNYLKTLHDGATIVPKRGKVLCFRVPLEDANPRYLNHIRKVRNWARAAAYRDGLDDSNSVLVFAKRVVIPPRPFLLDSWQQNEARITTDLQRVILRRLDGQP